MFWVRATLPRMRVDRLMNFAWKYLVPLSIVNILVAAVWYELVIRAAATRLTLVNWIKGTVVTGLLVGARGLIVVLLINRQDLVRRRVRSARTWPTVGRPLPAGRQRSSGGRSGIARRLVGRHRSNA